MIEKPLVVAVMVTGKDVKRYPMAMQSIESFLNQTYQNKYLLIVNDNAQSLLPQDYVPAGNIREIAVRFPLRQTKSHKESVTLGYLRNKSIEYALSENAEYIVQWDDDDFSHPDRIKYQVENTPKGSASIFEKEIHCHLYRREFFLNDGSSHRVQGFDGTMMFPASCQARFPEICRGEDTEFLLKLKEELPLVVIDNISTMYVRFYHGRNTWDEAHVMRRKPGSRNLDRDEESYIHSILLNRYESTTLEL